jgi:putative multiple sugar transport system ATP-binding protein
MKIADSITIIRDGKFIETIDCHKDEVSEDRIIKGMVGRVLNDRWPKRNTPIGEKFFEVKNWTVFHEQQPDRKVVDNVSFCVKKGEVVGLAGLMGAGRTELAMSIFGKSYGRNIQGEVYKNGREINTKTTTSAIQNGIAYVSEDRRVYGLVLIGSIKNNVTLVNLEKISRHNIINNNEEIIQVQKSSQALNIKCSSIQQRAMNLSGGNQQKVVLAKWMFKDSDVLILDEPTRGIDVGAKAEICRIINELVAEGKSVILISSELPEVISMSDRIYVMSDGKFKGELDKDQATQESIMKLIVEAGENNA